LTLAVIKAIKRHRIKSWARNLWNKKYEPCIYWINTKCKIMWDVPLLDAISVFGAFQTELFSFW